MQPPRPYRLPLLASQHEVRSVRCPAGRWAALSRRLRIQRPPVVPPYTPGQRQVLGIISLPAPAELVVASSFHLDVGVGAGTAVDDGTRLGPACRDSYEVHPQEFSEYGIWSAGQRNLNLAVPLTLKETQSLVWHDRLGLVDWS